MFHGFMAHYMFHGFMALITIGYYRSLLKFINQLVTNKGPTLYVWNIYLHLGNAWSRCRQIFHKWSMGKATINYGELPASNFKDEHDIFPDLRHET